MCAGVERVGLRGVSSGGRITGGFVVKTRRWVVKNVGRGFYSLRGASGVDGAGGTVVMFTGLGVIKSRPGALMGESGCIKCVVG